VSDHHTRTGGLKTEGMGTCMQGRGEARIPPLSDGGSAATAVLPVGAGMMVPRPRGEATNDP